MERIALRQSFWCGILLLGVTPSLWGHGSEFVFAKLSLASEPRSVILELSLEFLENPLVDSREEARQILSTNFLLESESGEVVFGDSTAPIEWGVRDTIDESAPIPPAEHAEEEGHRWLVARVDLSGLDSGSVSFRVQRESLQAVIFWVEEPLPDLQQAAEPVPDNRRRVFLIAGDRSMPVALPSRDREEEGRGPGRALPAVVAGLIAMAGWWLAEKRAR